MAAKQMHGCYFKIREQAEHLPNLKTFLEEEQAKYVPHRQQIAVQQQVEKPTCSICMLTFEETPDQ